MKIYILLYNDLMGTKQSVTAFLDSKREILNWATVTHHSVLIVSEKNVNELIQIFQNAFPGCYFLLSEIDGRTSNGFLPSWLWDFINNPKSSGRWV